MKEHEKPNYMSQGKKLEFLKTSWQTNQNFTCEFGSVEIEYHSCGAIMNVWAYYRNSLVAYKNEFGGLHVRDLEKYKEFFR